MIEMPKTLQKWIKKPITAVIDTREQSPLKINKYAPHIVEERGTLDHGDYSLSYPDMRIDLCVERKSIDDLVQSMSREHDRFAKELKAMRGYKYRMVIVECEFSDIFCGVYRSKVNPNAVMGFISYWSFIQNIPFLFCRHAAGASYVLANMLNHIAVREIKLSLLAQTVLNVPSAAIREMMPQKIIDDPGEDIKAFYEDIKDEAILGG